MSAENGHLHLFLWLALFLQCASESRFFTASTHLSLCYSLTGDENQLKTAFWQREKRNTNEKMSWDNNLFLCIFRGFRALISGWHSQLYLWEHQWGNKMILHCWSPYTRRLRRPFIIFIYCDVAADGRAHVGAHNLLRSVLGSGFEASASLTYTPSSSSVPGAPACVRWPPLWDSATVMMDDELSAAGQRLDDITQFHPLFPQKEVGQEYQSRKAMGGSVLGWGPWNDDPWAGLRPHHRPTARSVSPPINQGQQELPC